MCGIYGIVGQGIINVDLDIFYDLGVMNMLRGLDGSGIMSIGSTNSDVEVVKKGHEFVSLYMELENIKSKKFPNSKMFSRWDDFLSVNRRAIIGHNRHTTVGVSDGSSAHPYMIKSNGGDIYYGIHNGTVTSSTSYGTDILESVKKGEYLTDSHKLLTDIVNKGFDVLSKLDDSSDAYAIVLYNSTSGKLYFVRNDRRPLCVVTSKKRDLLIFSSEKVMVEACLKRNNQDIEDYRFWDFNTRTVFEINPRGINCKTERPWTHKDLPKPCPIKIERKTSTTTAISPWEDYESGIWKPSELHSQMMQ